MSPSESCMLPRAYEWPLQATFAESSLARRVPLLRPSPCRPTPIPTTALPFVVRLDADGAMTPCGPARRRRRACATVNSHCHGASTRGETLREKVLRDLASRAATDAGFLKQARRDLQGTLAGFGRELTLEELRLVEDFRRRTAAMSDEELARTLASGLRGRAGSPPARPAAPSWRGSGPGRPARPGS